MPSMFYVENPTGLPANIAADSAPRVGVTFSGTRRNLLINDVIEVMGARQPSSANSPRVFRQAFLFVVGRGRTAAPAAIAKMSGSGVHGNRSSHALWTIAGAWRPV